MKEFHPIPDPRPEYRDYVISEQEAIERIAAALTKRFIFSPGDQEDVDMATVAWNEMKAIAREDRVPERRWEDVEALDLR